MRRTVEAASLRRPSHFRGTVQSTNRRVEGCEQRPGTDTDAASWAASSNSDSFTKAGQARVCVELLPDTTQEDMSEAPATLGKASSCAPCFLPAILLSDRAHQGSAQSTRILGSPVRIVSTKCCMFTKGSYHPPRSSLGKAFDPASCIIIVEGLRKTVPKCPSAKVEGSLRTSLLISFRNLDVLSHIIP